MLKPGVLRKKKDFSSIYNRGKSVGDKYVVIFFKKNNLDYNREAFLASKKVGNSVKRNRARRLMKESYRIYKESIPLGNDIIFIARNTINGIKCGEVKKSIEAALKRCKLITWTWKLLKLKRIKLKKIIILLIRGYQIIISPLLPKSCRFYPTCSQYTILAIEKYGVFKGVFLGSKRILKCHPFHPGGYDPLK